MSDRTLWTARDEFHLSESREMVAVWRRLLDHANDPNWTGPRDSQIALCQYRKLIARTERTIADLEARKASVMEAA